MRTRLKTLAVAIAAACTSLGNAPAWAVDYYWVGGDGAWWDNYGATNWSNVPGGIGNLGQPPAGARAFLINTGAANLSALYYNEVFPDAVLDRLVLSATGAGSMTLRHTEGDHPLRTQNSFIGLAGSAVFEHSTGSHIVTSILRLGGDAGSNGTYNLSGSAVVSSAYSSLGWYGAANFNQSGGSHTVAGGYLAMGEQPSAVGIYNLSGGSFTAGLARIGMAGTGIVNHSGGSFAAAEIRLGEFVGGHGTYQLSGNAVLTTTNTVVGGDSFGTFEQRNGSHTVADQLTVGTVNGGVAHYRLLGGTLSAPTQVINRGAFSHGGGSNTVGNELTLGSLPGSSSHYVIESLGELNAARVTVGREGYGVFAQLGGSVNVSDTMVLGLGATAIGEHTLEAGTLTARSVMLGVAGIGTFEHLGGTSTVDDLHLGVATGSFGSYKLSSGTLNVNRIINGPGYGHFIFEGGLLNLAAGSTIDVDRFNISNRELVLRAGRSLNARFLVGDSASTITLSGGDLVVSTQFEIGAFNVGELADSSFVLAAGATLRAGNAHVGLFANGSITQTGGTASFTSLTLGLVAGRNGTYTLSGGTLSAGGIFDSGSGTSTFNLDGGTLVLGSAGFPTVSNFNIGPAASYDRPITVTHAMVNRGSVSVSGLLTVGGSLDNSGRLLLAGGTLAGAGALANHGLLLGHGTIAGSGGFSNTAQLQQSSGNLVLSNTGANSNSGSWEMLAGYQLQLQAATLSNNGALYLNNGQVSGSGLLTNAAGGTVTGRGTISSPFSNAGALVIDAGNITVSNAFSNSGQIQLGSHGASLLGGALANSGRIEGFGRVGNAVNNTGIVKAAGGTLTLTGGLSNTGTLQANHGAELMVTTGLDVNAGTIQLNGGSFDNNGKVLSNTGAINGAGSLRAGFLFNHGKLQLSGGVSSVFTNLYSTPASKIMLSGNSNTTFYGVSEFENGAELRVSAGSVATFFARVFQRTGASFTGTGAKFYEGGLTIGASPGLGLDAGDVTFGDGNDYEAEIASAALGDAQGQGIGFDRYQVAGRLTFGGALNVVLLGNYQPQAGQRFDLFDWGSAQGSFDVISYAAAPLAAGLAWDSSRLYTTGELSVTAVPEPAPTAMLLAGLGLLAVLARRRPSRAA